jgi:hypothetical protein
MRPLVVMRSMHRKKFSSTLFNDAVGWKCYVASAIGGVWRSIDGMMLTG